MTTRDKTVFAHGEDGEARTRRKGGGNGNSEEERVRKLTREDKIASWKAKGKTREGSPGKTGEDRPPSLRSFREGRSPRHTTAWAVTHKCGPGPGRPGAPAVTQVLMNEMGLEAPPPPIPRGAARTFGNAWKSRARWKPPGAQNQEVGPDTAIAWIKSRDVVLCANLWTTYKMSRHTHYSETSPRHPALAPVSVNRLPPCRCGCPPFGGEGDVA